MLHRFMHPRALPVLVCCASFLGRGLIQKPTSVGFRAGDPECWEGLHHAEIPGAARGSAAREPPPEEAKKFRGSVQAWAVI